MTTGGEHSPAEVREAELARVFKRMGKAARRGDTARYAELRAEHDRLKDAHVMASHAEAKAAMRARRAEERAQQAREAPKRWRPPRGFGRSPLARERDRHGGPREEPVMPAGGLHPWRRAHPMSERIWRPGG